MKTPLESVLYFINQLEIQLDAITVDKTSPEYLQGKKNIN